MRLTRIAAILAATVLCGCATLQQHNAGQTWTADGGSVSVKKAENFRLHYGLRYGTTSSSIQLVDCALATPCTASGPINTGTGDPAYLAFYKQNDNWQQVENVIGATGLLIGNGPIPNAFTALNPSSAGTWCLNWSTAPGTPTTIACPSGSGSVSDGSGTTTANEVALSTSTAHTIGYATTLPTSALPALAGDVTSSAGSNSVTVSKVSGVSGTPTTVTFYNNTSGTGVLEAPTGVALGTLTWTLPDATGTLLYSGGPGGTPSSINLSGATALTLPVSAINATGTASSTTYLAGNGTWATPAGTGTVTTTGTPASGNIAAFSGSTSITPATAAQILATVNGQTCNAQTGTTYTFALTDANSCVTMSNAAANTITVPANSSVAFPVGTTLTVIQTGAGATTLEGAGSPVTLESAKYGSSTTQTYAFAAEYSCISIQKTATDTWLVSECDYNPDGGSGTVTSVGMTVPAWLSVAGSPVTSSGTLAVTAATGQTANEVLASPNGTTGAVGLRALVGADLPPINLASTANGGVTGTLGVANGGTGATSSVTYLIDTGTAFTLGTGTGACATDSVVAAGAANGEVTCTGTTGASTIVVNLPTATHGWACSASDITQKTSLPESAFTTTSATVSGTVTASDDIVIGCTGF